MYTYLAHIFKQRRVGSREEVKLKLFTQDGEPINLCGTPGLPSSDGDPEGAANLAEHVVSDIPHPVYDDGPSLTLLYENAKV